MASLNWYFVTLVLILGLNSFPMSIRLIKGRISTLSSINRGSPTCPHARHLWIHQNHDRHRNTIRDEGSTCAFNNTRSLTIKVIQHFSSLTFDLRTPLLQGEVVFPKPLQVLPSPCTKWWLFIAKWVILPRFWFSPTSSLVSIRSWSFLSSLDAPAMISGVAKVYLRSWTSSCWTWEAYSSSWRGPKKVTKRINLK